MTRSLVLGVAGGSASGKSTVVREVVRLLGPGRTAWLPHDAYYHDLSHMAPEARKSVNVDHPDSLETALLVRHIGELLSGRAVEIPRYDFVSMTRARQGLSVEPAPVVLVEGLMVLHEAALRDMMELKVFVDASEAERLERRIERDMRERGRTREEVIRQHQDRVEPMHRAFVAPTRVHADVVLSGGGHNEEAVRGLVARIEETLTGP